MSLSQNTNCFSMCVCDCMCIYCIMDQIINNFLAIVICESFCSNDRCKLLELEISYLCLKWQFENLEKDTQVVADNFHIDMVEETKCPPPPHQIKLGFVFSCYVRTGFLGVGSHVTVGAYGSGAA